MQTNDNLKLACALTSGSIPEPHLDEATRGKVGLKNGSGSAGGAEEGFGGEVTTAAEVDDFLTRFFEEIVRSADDELEVLGGFRGGCGAI